VIKELSSQQVFSISHNKTAFPVAALKGFEISEVFLIYFVSYPQYLSRRISYISLCPDSGFQVNADQLP